MTNRLATITQNFYHLDNRQASTPAHLPGLLNDTPPNGI